MNSCNQFIPRSPARRDAMKITGSASQSGAVLATSLILLLIMTIIGITALNTTKMEQRMAGNYQSVNRALETAETGLAAVTYGIPDTDHFSGDVTKTSSDYIGVASISRDFLYFAKLQRQSSKISSAVRFRRALFEAESSGDIKNGDGDILSSTTVHGGFYLVVPDPAAK